MEQEWQSWVALAVVAGTVAVFAWRFWKRRGRGGCGGGCGCDKKKG